MHLESGILGFGIRNTAQGIRNPTNDWNQGSQFRNPDPESASRNPESRTALDTLTWGESQTSQVSRFHDLSNALTS